MYIASRLHVCFHVVLPCPFQDIPTCAFCPLLYRLCLLLYQPVPSKNDYRSSVSIYNAGLKNAVPLRPTLIGFLSIYQTFPPSLYLFLLG